MTSARINDQLAMLLGNEVADWEREELADTLAGLSPEIRRQALKHLPVIWPVSYALYYAFVEQAAKASSCLHPSQFSAWVNAALDVYEADGLRAAQLFLEEVESNFLCEIRGEAAARFSEVEHRLLPYARSLLGREVRLIPAETTSFDTNTLFLPPEIDLFHNQRQNFLLYKFTITFLLSLDRMGTFRARTCAGGASLSVAEWIGSLHDPRLATDLFYLAEAIRIVARFRHDFPGLMTDFAEFCPALLAQTPAVPGVLDQGTLVAGLRRWLLCRPCVPSPVAVEPLSPAVLSLLADHYAMAGEAGQSLILARVLYDYAAALPGPYRPGEALPFMGELSIEAACTAIDQRREEREEKLIEALSRMMAEQQKGAGEEGGGEEEDEPAPGRQGLTDNQGSMLVAAPGRDLEAEDLEQQLAQGVLRIGGMEFELTEELKELLREMMREQGSIPSQAIVSAAGRAGSGLEQGATAAEEEENEPRAAGPLVYDEWDFRRAGFRKHWCQVQVKELSPVAGTFVATTLHKYRGLLVSLRRQFEMMSVQETFVKRQRDGNEIDLDAVVEALSDARAGCSPSERLFIRLQRNQRQIATLFLLDMSSSTEGWVSTALKESLILMCEALSALGDRYAIYGFSGMRRLRSEIFTVKEFDEPYDSTIKGRIAAITPKEYTRMGPAIRHATSLLAATEARVRLLITLSDGKPEDYDGYKGAYAIEDTRHALIEAKMAGIHPFCITVDKEAHAYMAHMYGEVNYICIDQVTKLPRRMPEIYRNLTT